MTSFPYFSRPPVIICGSHGGGTSFVTKMLRFCGFFPGNDTGRLLDRKYHESASFLNYNMEFGAAFDDQHIFDEAILKRIDKELAVNLDFWVKKAQDRLEEIEDAYIGSKKELPWTLKGYMLYNFGSFRKDKIWGWKGYMLDLFKKCNSGQPWGWKDPRNSVTLPIWKKIFEKHRILVIRKHRTGKPSKSTSGNWFENRASEYQLNYYQSPPTIEKDDDVLYVQFEDVVLNVENLMKC